MKLLFFVSIAFLISSCAAFHSGELTLSTNHAPVVHKDIAIGVSKATKILGLGGSSKDALVFEARQKMIRNRPLVNAEQFNNVSVDIKNTFYLGVQVTKVTIIADVVEPKDSLSQNSYSELYLKKSLSQNHNIDELFSIGDSVLFNRKKSAELISFEGEIDSKARIKYYTKNGDTRTKIIKLNNLYAIIPSYNEYKLGDRLSGGEIIAFGKKGAIVKIENDNLFFPYAE